MFNFELHFNNASAGKQLELRTIPVDLKQLEAEWRKNDPDMQDLKGYGTYVQEQVQQAEGIELPAA